MAKKIPKLMLSDLCGNIPSVSVIAKVENKKVEIKDKQSEKNPYD
jgi:hypothetical protein